MRRPDTRFVRARHDAPRRLMPIRLTIPCDVCGAPVGVECVDEPLSHLSRWAAALTEVLEAATEQLAGVS